MPEPGASGSNFPDSIASRIERAHSAKGASTFSPVREDVSRNRAPRKGGGDGREREGDDQKETSCLRK